jgi:hypothetical protein
MHGDADHVVIIGKPEQEGPDERSSRKVEWALNFFGDDAANFEVAVVHSSV